MTRDYFVYETHPAGKDAQGQPPLNLNKTLRCERGIDEMLGICKGILSDGEVVEKEAAFLSKWMQENLDVCSVFPGKLLFERLNRIFSDDVCSAEERAELQELLISFTGQTDEIPAGQTASTRIVFEDPEPEIVFVDRTFSFTGKFISGTRKWCVEQTTSRGGIFHEKPTVRTTFLVIGTGGSRDWIHSAYGRKIEAAVEYREKYGTKIVSEEHWAKFL